MILVHCLRLEQSYDLNTEATQTFLVLGLPNGKETRAPIDEETAAYLIAQPSARETLSREPEPVKEKVADAPVSTLGLQPAPRAEPAEPLIEWMLLPDSELSPLMKTALQRLGVASALPLTALQALIPQIVDQLSPEQWKELEQSVPAVQVVEATPRPPSPPPQPAAPRAPLRQVTWADGQPIMPSSRPSRTVQKDDKGYPIVPRTGVSAAEVLGGSRTGGTRDEEGVQSV